MAATYGGTCEQIPNKRLWIWKLDLPSRLRLFNEVEPYFNVFIESECDYIRDRFYAEIERLRKRSLGG